MVLLEGAFIIPILVAMFFATYEIASYLRAAEKMDRTANDIAAALATLSNGELITTDNSTPPKQVFPSKMVTDIISRAGALASPNGVELRIAFCARTKPGNIVTQPITNKANLSWGVSRLPDRFGNFTVLKYTSPPPDPQGSCEGSSLTTFQGCSGFMTQGEHSSSFVSVLASCRYRSVFANLFYLGNNNPEIVKTAFGVNNLRYTP